MVALRGCAKDELGVHVGGGGEVMVVGFADGFHGEPVVLGRAEGEGQQGDEDEGREQ